MLHTNFSLLKNLTTSSLAKQMFAEFCSRRSPHDVVGSKIIIPATRFSAVEPNKLYFKFPLPAFFSCSGNQ